MLENIYLSVIIPAYNEEKRIGTTLKSIDEYLKKQNYDYEIIIVANNCIDKTDEVVRNYQQKIKNLKLIDIQNGCGGKGCAVKIGIEKALGDFLLFMDADNSTRIHEVDKFWPYFKKGFGVVIGSRALKDSKIKIKQSWYREILGRLANALVRVTLLPKIYDTQCGFKAFTKKAALDIFSRQKIVGWGFDMEVLALAKKFGFKIKEVPIAWFNAPESKVSLGTYFSTLRELFQIRWWLWRGKYNH
jgi:dolichyl-phosphate beta-glucosyltransferase